MKTIFHNEEGKKIAEYHTNILLGISNVLKLKEGKDHRYRVVSVEIDLFNSIRKVQVTTIVNKKVMKDKLLDLEENACNILNANRFLLRRKCRKQEVVLVRKICVCFLVANGVSLVDAAKEYNFAKISFANTFFTPL